MLSNIIDRRKHPYRFKKITAIVEPTWHDNHCQDADQCEMKVAWFGYDEKLECTVNEALEWGFLKPGENTLFLYDLGQGTDIVNITLRRQTQG